jgi:hypothetical protein
MKKNLSFMLYLTIYYCIAALSAFGQTTFGEQQVVSSNANMTTGVHVADIDRDGDNDVLSFAQGNQSIVWYENNGYFIFEHEHIIAEGVRNIDSNSIADLDNDGDIDVVLCGEEKQVIWYKNDGNGNFGMQQEIAAYSSMPFHIDITDIDKDMDLDIIVVGHAIDWYENDGSGYFVQHQISTTISDNITFATVYDINNDGYNDILAASLMGNELAWYLNNNNNQFVEKSIIPINISYGNPILSDIDSDNDIDIFVLSYFDNSLNIVVLMNDGNGNFSEPQKINRLDWITPVYSSDLDNDSDMDIITTTGFRSKLVWYENNQGMNELSHTIDSAINNIRFMQIADMDNDSDKDVIIIFDDKNTIAWYENLLFFPTPRPNIPSNSYQIYPNPTNTYLTIQQRTASVAYYILYNTIGQAVAQGTFNTPSHTISVEPLPAGIYYLQINGQCLKVAK